MLLYRSYSNQRQMHQAALRHVRSHNSDAAHSPPPPPQSPSISGGSTSESPSPAPECRDFFKALANDASAAKKRRRTESAIGVATPNPYCLDVPANARLKYHVYVKDKADGSDLAAPSTYRHTDYMIARGALAGLKAAFQGQDPIFVIQTPSGRKGITNEDEWEHAVLSVYNARRSGGVVEVEVFV